MIWINELTLMHKTTDKLPVDLHSNRLKSGWRLRGLQDLLDQLACYFPLRKVNICLIPRNMTFQTDQIKHGEVTAL